MGVFQIEKMRKVAPRARFELATLRLTAECSTVELPGIRAGRIARHRFQSSEPSEECQRGQALRAERPGAGLARFSALSRQPRYGFTCFI
jgi:hypothetical protein